MGPESTPSVNKINTLPPPDHDRQAQMAGVALHPSTGSAAALIGGG